MSGPISEKRPATFADIDALPEGISGELIGGTLYTSPRPAGPHALATNTLHLILGNVFQRGAASPKGWWILQEPQLYLEADSLIPDIAGWRREKMPRVPQDHRFDIVPDWVCEALSHDPKSRKKDRRLKPPIYHREGVGHLWLLDPSLRSLEIFRREEAGWLLLGEFGEDDLVRAESFQEVEIDLLELWGESRPAP
jgi:Uma2 family endonuclease